MEAAQPDLALDAVAPYKSGPGLSRGGDTGAEEIESCGQEPSSSTGQSVSGENVKLVIARTQIFSSCCKE